MTSGRPKRTPEKMEAFLAYLATSANVTSSAAAAGLARRSVYEWRAADPDFAAAWQAAQELGTDALEDEAVRRAAEGWLEPVYGKGVRTLEPVLNDDGTVRMGEDGNPIYVPASVRKFSDLLLIFALKARRPDKYRDHQTIDLTVTHTVSERLEAALKRVETQRGQLRIVGTTLKE